MRGGRGAVRGGRGRGGDREGRGAGKEGQADRQEDVFGTMDPAEKAFDEAMRFGTQTQYNPSLTLESLAEFMPATPSTPAGRAATALRNLSLLGPADSIGGPLKLQARSYAQDLEAGGVRFFADANAREETEAFLQQKRRDEGAAAAAGSGSTEGGGGEGRIIQPADDAIRQAIVDKAIVGRHEAPQCVMDPVGLSRSWHLRSETYTQNDVDAFEKKLQSLLGKANARQGTRQKARAA